MKTSLILGTLLLSLTSPSKDADYLRLQTVLEQYGFKIKLETPPVREAYGAFESQTRTIWINPIVFDLGIAKPTLVHEAVHAAQFCYGKTEVQALGLDIEPPPMTRLYFMRYHSFTRQIEAEAYTIQVQPNSVDLVISLLNKHCRKK
ncbi:hypothetical protein [Chroococcus sp. FPU101]|uniref:hypothetical protein n=1 Tax=Chroococcus sp. FPU101 TaxID=1974212 RepID=UPI001A8F7FAA|nr:hypothetical protein [Chroococcus sp. FPU101]GFE70267.1 hypothetical protein CFPU101_28770 [Chroococcus sp. FPU101]